MREIGHCLAAIGLGVCLEMSVMSRSGLANISQVVDIQLNAANGGVELWLETADGQPLRTFKSQYGTTVNIDVTGAQLAQAGQFSQASPVDDIAQITVTPLDQHSFRIQLVGVSAGPVVQVNQVETGLMISASPAIPASSTSESVVPTLPESGSSAPAADAIPVGDLDPMGDGIPDETGVDGTADETGLRIIVTAEKQPEDVQNVPISITVFDEQQLEDADITSFGEIADNTPNFSFFNRGESRFFSVYSVRGISNLSFASQDAVAFFVDDVPYDFGSFLDFDLLDLERVEVLRGPQSTLYGRSSLAGVVNVITRPPSNEFEFSGAADLGSYDDTSVRGSVSVPIVPDNLFFRLSGGYSARDGYVFNKFLDEDADDQSGWTGRAQLLWTPSEDWEITLRGSVDDYEEGISPLVLLSQSDPFETQLDFDEFNEIRSNAQSLKVSYTHPDFQVNSITTRRESNQDAGIDLDYTTADARAELIDYRSTVFGQELRVQSPADSDRLQWLVGSYFESFNFEDEGGILHGQDGLRLGFGFPPGFEQRNSEIERETFAVFGQLGFKPIESLRLTAGLRYESNESTLEGYTRTFTDESGFLSIPLLSIGEINQNGSEFSPRFVAEYLVSPDVMAYGSISRGFRPAGVNLTPFSLETATFEAETSWNYEVGLKSSWLEDRLFANLAVFYNPVNNFQFVGFQPATRTLFVGNADVDIFGAELELRATPVEGLDLTAGLGLVDAEFQDSTDPFTGDSFDGNQVSYAPGLTYNVAAQYRSPAGIFGRLELIGFGKTYLDNDNSFAQDPYAIVNARLGYEVDSFGIYVFADNLFDTRYLTQVLTSTPARGAFGAPATFGLQVKNRF